MKQISIKVDVIYNKNNKITTLYVNKFSNASKSCYNPTILA